VGHEQSSGKIAGFDGQVHFETSADCAGVSQPQLAPQRTPALRTTNVQFRAAPLKKCCGTLTQGGGRFEEVDG
jgi:hypothetical protein